MTLGPSAPCKMKIISGVPLSPVVGGVFACLSVFGDGLGTTGSGQNSQEWCLSACATLLTQANQHFHSPLFMTGMGQQGHAGWSCFESPISQAGDGPAELTYVQDLGWQVLTYLHTPGGVKESS